VPIIHFLSKNKGRKTYFQKKREERKKKKLVEIRMKEKKRKEVVNESVWHVVTVHSQWSICLRVYSYCFFRESVV